MANKKIIKCYKMTKCLYVNSPGCWKWRCLTLIIFMIFSLSWAVCSSCWGSSSGSWTWNTVSRRCRRSAPDPPLPTETRRGYDGHYSSMNTDKVERDSQKHRNSESTPMLYTLKKPWAIRYEPNTTVCSHTRQKKSHFTADYTIYVIILL